MTSSKFAEDRQDWFKTFLELPAGILCDDTFRRVFADVDLVKFQTGFSSCRFKRVTQSTVRTSLLGILVDSYI